MKKYEFTGETKRVELWNRTATLHRIKATVEFGFVKVGNLVAGSRKKKIFPMKERLGFVVMPRFVMMPRFGAMPRFVVMPRSFWLVMFW